MVNNKEVYIRFVKKMMNLLVIFSFLVILIQTFNDMSSFSNNNNIISSDTSELIDKEKSYKHNITAILYNTNRYADDGEGTKLTENGISVDNWVQNTSKYLQIDVDVHAYENEVHSVKIELPKELYIVGSINKLPAGYSDVKFKKNNDISVNGGADTYNINDHSGVLTYYLQPNVERASIQIELRYDEVLWDKMNNTSITPNNIAPVKVSINYHPDSNTSVKLNEVKINKITSGEKTSKQGYFYYSSPYDLLDRNTKDLDIVIDSTYNEISYYKEAIFEIQIPYYKDDYGNRYYLDYDINELFFNKVCFGGKVNYNILTANDSVIKIKVENALFSIRDINSPYHLIILPLTFPRELKVDSTFVKFSGGKFIVHGTSNNENKYIVLSSDIFDTTYATKDIEYVDVICGCGGSVTFEKGAKNVVMMGGYYVENYGKKNSVPKTMHMTFPNKMLITSINILSDTTSMSRNITYSLIDSNGNPVYLDKNGYRVSAETKGAISSWVYKLNNINYKKEKYDNIFENFNRQLLPANQRKYYFSKVSYTVDTIRGGSKMYNDSALYSYKGTGNFYGVFRNDVKTSDTLITNIRISSPSSSGIADLNYTINTRPTLTRNSAYCIKNVSMSEDSIRAGESLDIIGNVCVVEYPFAENTILEKIKIGLILPKGVLIDGTSAINLTSSVGDKVNVTSLTHNSINSTNNIWIISVDDSCRIGFAKETLGAIKTGDKLKFKIRLNTSQSLNALTLFSDEILLTAGEGISNKAYGSYTWTKAVDLYDLNNNGVTTDTIGKMNPPDRVQCTIIPDNPSLDITDYITVQGVGNSTGTSANLKNSADIATYNLSVKNNDNGVASKFEYYIPIPKKKFAYDKYLLFSEDERAFNFEMIEKPTIVGNDIFEFQYSTQSNLTYYDVRGINESEWITQDDMDSKKYDWSQITMIKITAKSNNIQIGSNTLISIKLRYGDLDFNGNYGKMNKWRSSGYYDYRTSTKVYSGHYKTSGCTATINYGLEVFDEITINAIANTAPNKINKVVATAFKNDSEKDYGIPLTELKQEFLIKEINLKNINLKDENYILDNQNSMTAEEADKNIALVMQLDNKEEIDLSNGVNKCVGICEPLKLNENHFEFNFKMYYGSNYRDIDTERKVEIVLQSDIGLVVRINVNITFASKDPIIIDNGEKYKNESKLFYTYEYDDVLELEEPIEIFVQQAYDYDATNEEYHKVATEVKIYDENDIINHNNIIIYDEHGEKIKYSNGYKLEGNRKYYISFVKEYYYNIQKGGRIVFIEAKTPDVTDTKLINIIRRKIFNYS